MTKKFKMPAKQNLKGRSSTISNAFVIGITPYIRPDDSELEAYYSALGIQEGQCAYCLGDGNGRDHLKPLVINGMPSGYITDIHNLVPCCQKCNSSKGSKDFKTWYKSKANIKRLKQAGLSDQTIEERYNKICEYEKLVPEPLNYEALVGKELWNEYKARLERLQKELSDNQMFCDKLNEIITKAIKK